MHYQPTMRRPLSYQEDDQPKQKQTIYHIWREEIPIEDEAPVIEDDPEPDPEPENRHPTLGAVLSGLLVLLSVSIPLLTLVWLPQVVPQSTYDSTLTRTLTLTLSEHPTTGQIEIVSLPVIHETEHLTVSASGTIHQEATKALGLLTLYNGLFTTQTVPAGTQITGRDGVSVVTLQSATVPPATPTTPPTDGTVSFPAEATQAGAAGDIAAQDINQVCCGSAILAINLNAFSGGQDARTVPLLTQNDLTQGQHQLTAQVDAAVNASAQAELKPGDILFPLDCQSTLTATHQAGDQAATATLTLTESCTPRTYFAPEIVRVAQRLVPIPAGSHLVSFSVLVLASRLIPTGGTLTVEAIVYLKHNAAPVRLYLFPGK